MDAANDDDAGRQRLRNRLRTIWHHVRKANHRTVARAAVAAHLSYYSLVFVEAHGWYGTAGGICGIVLLIEVILGHGNNDEE